MKSARTDIQWRPPAEKPYNTGRVLLHYKKKEELEVYLEGFVCVDTGALVPHPRAWPGKMPNAPLFRWAWIEWDKTS